MPTGFAAVSCFVANDFATHLTALPWAKFVYLHPFVLFLHIPFVPLSLEGCSIWPLIILRRIALEIQCSAASFHPDLLSEDMATGLVFNSFEYPRGRLFHLSIVALFQKPSFSRRSEFRGVGLDWSSGMTAPGHPRSMFQPVDPVLPTRCFHGCKKGSSGWASVRMLS